MFTICSPKSMVGGSLHASSDTVLSTILFLETTLKAEGNSLKDSSVASKKPCFLVNLGKRGCETRERLHNLNHFEPQGSTRPLPSCQLQHAATIYNVYQCSITSLVEGASQLVMSSPMAAKTLKNYASKALESLRPDFRRSSP